MFYLLLISILGPVVDSEEASPQQTPQKEAQQSEALQIEIDQLILKLASDRFQERRQSGRRLISIGKPALAALNKAAGSKTAEVRVRAKRALNSYYSREVLAILRRYGATVHFDNAWNVVEITVNDHRFGDEELAILFKRTKLQHLWRLDLNNTTISDASLDLLVQLHGMELLRLQNTKVTHEGRVKLRRAIPGCLVDNPLQINGGFF